MCHFIVKEFIMENLYLFGDWSASCKEFKHVWWASHWVNSPHKDQTLSTWLRTPNPKHLNFISCLVWDFGSCTLSCAIRNLVSSRPILEYITMNLNINRIHVNIIGMVLAFFAPLFNEKVKMTILPFLCYHLWHRIWITIRWLGWVYHFPYIISP